MERHWPELHRDLETRCKTIELRIPELDPDSQRLVEIKQNRIVWLEVHNHLLEVIRGRESLIDFIESRLGRNGHGNHNGNGNRATGL